MRLRVYEPSATTVVHGLTALQHHVGFRNTFTVCTFDRFDSLTVARHTKVNDLSDGPLSRQSTAFATRIGGLTVYGLESITQLTLPCDRYWSERTGGPVSVT
eukprot:gene19643-biopygen6219